MYLAERPADMILSYSEENDASVPSYNLITPSSHLDQVNIYTCVRACAVAGLQGLCCGFIVAHHQRLLLLRLGRAPEVPPSLTHTQQSPHWPFVCYPRPPSTSTAES